jgi:hypothetical protein
VSNSPKLENHYNGGNHLNAPHFPEENATLVYETPEIIELGDLAELTAYTVSVRV